MAVLSTPYPRYRLYTKLSSYTSALRDCLLRRMTKGPDVEILERAICQKFHVAHAVCVPMARMGIYLTLKNLIKPGQRVIMSPYTIADVVNMVICAGGVPIFADIQRQTCNIDPSEVDRLIDSTTGAVLVTHLHGIAASTYEILDICRARGVPLVEDAAQAFGAVQQTKRLGTIGDAGVYSFGMYKNINAWYGGAVVTERSELIDAIRSQLQTFGYQRARFILKRIRKGALTDIMTFPPLFRWLTFWVFRYGCLHDVQWINRKVQTELDTRRHDAVPAHYLARMTPFQARLALSQLDRIDSDSKTRIISATLYYDALKDINGLTLPPPPEGLANIYTSFPAQCENREDLIKWLMVQNRDVAPQHLKNCADLPEFSEFHRHCPQARRTAQEVVLLPTYPRYRTSEVSKNIDVLRGYFNTQKHSALSATTQ